VIDLHTHSTVSDGSDAPERVVELAAEAGCTAVALTDHDRLDGIGAASNRARALSIELVPGCEISCRHAATMHLLVYFVEPGDGPLQDALVRLQEIRDRRNERMAAALGLDYADLVAEAGGMGAGRPHAAVLLVRQGRAHSIDDAFDRYLTKGRPGHVAKERLAATEAIELALGSGGAPVLAHPLSLGETPADLDRTVGELAALGLAGLEAHYGRYPPDDRNGLAAMAAHHGLVATGGSDHHGTYKPDLHVGVGLGDLDVPDSAIAELRARL
jgi:predicted metal-dependent phosphoesterase TrpH